MLPEFCEDIVAFLKAQGIHGNDSSQPITVGCPIGQWINRWTDGRCAVNWRFISVGFGVIKTPTHVGAFINRYDTGGIKGMRYS